MALELLPYGPDMPESDYAYSKEMLVRAWPTGKIWIQVGYVRQHPERNRVVLCKSWIGSGGKLRTEKYNIRDAADWNAIRQAVELLWPEIAQQPNQQEIDAAIRKVSSEVGLLELVAQYPELLSRIPENIDILRLPDSQKEALAKFLLAGEHIAHAVIARLSSEPIKDLEDFLHILTELRLSTINVLVNHVRSRLSFIKMFETAIHNDAAYERRGKGSIHNLLKANIWIVDRNYTILHDDETLKNIIYIQWSKQADEPSLKQRPDFLCMANRQRYPDDPREIVLIEIKRPSITLRFDHISQLMQYRNILQRYSGKPISSFNSYLIGREVDPTLSDLSASGFIVKTYTDFIAEARSFYEEYLQIVQAEDYAI
jgi:hypothetical protein